MILSATTGAIGGKVLYLLFIWLLSAAGAAWLSERKGYTERVGLTFGLVLTFVGFFIVLLLPARPGSTWKREGPLPRRRRPGAEPGARPSAPESGPPLPPAEG
ncbi:MAG: hypothetical protein M3071_21430 [Actinomycetota bacterium]|nr:hypothetical protein [Actinomycetota bacterium]